MKKKTRITALALALIMLTGTLAACGQAGTVTLYDAEDAALLTDETVEFDLSWQMVPLSKAPATDTLLLPATGKEVKKNQKAEIDYSNMADGYVMIKFVAKTTKSIKVQIVGPTGVKYQFDLRNDGKNEVFPLADGNGKYQIGVFEQVEGTKYSSAISHTIDVKLKDEFAPFLRPNQYVNFNADSDVVKKAAELVKGSKDLPSTITAVYNFVTTNITYDKNFAEEVKKGGNKGYVPDVDKVLKNKKGVCFDYAALMAAMLRSQGIPTKLVIGYAGKDYHAWIDVYSKETGWVNSVIQFDGKQWKLMDPTFASSVSAEKLNEYIGDGKNYSVCFLY